MIEVTNILLDQMLKISKERDLKPEFAALRITEDNHSIFNPIKDKVKLYESLLDSAGFDKHKPIKQRNGDYFMYMPLNI